MHATARWLAGVGLCGLAVSAANAEPPPLSAYGNLPDVEQAALSPSGKSVVFLTVVKGQRALTMTEVGKGPRFRAAMGDSKVRQVSWAGEETVLVTINQAAALGPQFTAPKYELSQLLIMPIEGGAPRFLFSGSGTVANVLQGNYGVRELDGRWVGYFGGIKNNVVRNPRADGIVTLSPNLFRVDLAKNEERSVADPAPQGHRRSWLVDASGRVAATYDITIASGSWSIVNGSGTSIAVGKDATGEVCLVSLGKDGTSVIYSVEDDATNDLRYFEVPLAGGPATEVINSDRSVQLFIDRADGRLLGYAERTAPRNARFFDPAKQATYDKTMRAFPKVRAELVDWSSDFKTLLVHTSGNRDSGSWYYVNVADRKADLIGSDRPAIPDTAIGQTSTMEFKASDGLAMNGILTLPPGRASTNLPVVILPHDGPAGHDDPVFDWRAQAFASRGYAVFQPNFRGSTNLDYAFRKAGDGQWGRAMQTDLSDGLAELARRGIVDPKRACIVGIGYGGYAALAGVTLQRGIYRCAVAVAPVSDLGDMYTTENRQKPGNPIARRSLEESLGSPAGFAAVSPRKHAREADAPILLIHGKDDTVVPLKQSTAMADALKDAGKPHELVVMPGEDHWLSRSASRLQMLEASVAFVQKHNPAN
jgi:dienelactone hydrolase